MIALLGGIRMSNETDIVEAVDEIVDDLDVDRLEDEPSASGSHQSTS